MNFKRYYYLISLQYLGFRFHGWQIQPNVPTVELMIKKTLRFILPDAKTKIMACGRTDAMVSAEQTYVELFSDQKLPNLDVFLGTFNYNLPADIKALNIKEVDNTFNIIQDSKVKEYHYYFAFGGKFHPFSATLMCHVKANLDIEIMTKATKAFKGKKDFYSYTFRPKTQTQTTAEILSCQLRLNNELTASFFPKQSYVLKVKGTGFKRNQIRLMMGMLFDLGQHKVNYDFFLKTLDGYNKIKLEHIAPASGLILHKVEF
ncbi:tRNA pseudouridine(38-40) synthase TruA [Flavobacterium sp. CS20]|uniref:tRNA pseudouridine(38-40) synthase TruA n=1 Tax=Flavobacterium sp. CS20 TaxID=2775246 RepID=UPI001B39D403|nr:tRNA pseudouridine(38-40) synthase TruA [Flavobacterium sp. CS20]QTY26197.1 tRNA pseudouridine(38-40) synthase TruA [Flavobacterium sp. CS20]